MRFWDPENGQISILGKDLRNLPVEQVRSHIALVTQDTYLFNTTLRANIHIARPEASEQAVMEAVSRAALTDFVESLPEGLETSVGERGVRLSGGQRQRVAIAGLFSRTPRYSYSTKPPLISTPSTSGWFTAPWKS